MTIGATESKLCASEPLSKDKTFSFKGCTEDAATTSGNQTTCSVGSSPYQNLILVEDQQKVLEPLSRSRALSNDCLEELVEDSCTSDAD